MMFICFTDFLHSLYPTEIQTYFLTNLPTNIKCRIAMTPKTKKAPKWFLLKNVNTGS